MEGSRTLQKRIEPHIIFHNVLKTFNNISGSSGTRLHLFFLNFFQKDPVNAFQNVLRVSVNFAEPGSTSQNLIEP